MASGTPGTIAGVSPVIASPAIEARSQPVGGKILPQVDKSAAAPRSSSQTLVEQVNKYLNDSGRPDQFRVSPDSADYIQEVNPSSGAVVAEYSATEFPALARSVGASGLLIDDLA
jgi:hypothetical protein